MKKKILPCILILILIYFCIFPIQWNIDQVYTAYLVDSQNMESERTLEVRVNGKYKFYLFRADTFEGHIGIEGYSGTFGEVTLKLEDGMDELVYREWERTELHSVFFGMISADFGFRNFIILKSDSSGVIALNEDRYCAIASEEMSESDIEAFREKLLELR